MKSGIPGLRNDFDREFTAARLALLLGLLMLISYPDIVLGTHAFFFRDAGQFSYPVANYLRDCFWRHEVPLWNPYNDCGLPFLAQWNTLALYPPSLFYMVLPMPWAMNYFILGHVFLAGLGMYFLAWRWFGSRFAASVAGLAFAWNGLTINCWMWPCHIAALGWMPWVVLLCERTRDEGRRPFVWAALAGACQMMTGSPEVIIFTWLIIGGSFLVWVWPEKRLFWSVAGRLVRVAGVIALLCAVQLLPTFDLLAHGDRTTASGDSTWSMPVWGAANFLVPLFRMNGSVSGIFLQADQQWTTSYYMGIVTLALALLAMWKVRTARVIFLGGLTLLGVLCAMGDAGLVLKLLKMILPALGVIRFPIKFLLLPVFCVPLLAAAGVVWLQRSDALAARRYLLWTAGAVGAAVVVITCNPFTEDSRESVAGNGATRLLVLATAVAGIWFQPRFEQKRWQLITCYGLLFLLGVDVCSHFPRQNPTIPASDYAAFTPPMTQIPSLGDSRAMLGREAQTLMGGVYNADLEKMYLAQRTVLYSDCNLLEKIPKVNGFVSIHLKEEGLVGRELYREEAPKLREFLGVSQVCERLFAWEPRTNFMHWASIGQQPVFKDEIGTLAELSSANFEPRKKVFLPSETSGDVTAQADPGARILSSYVTAEQCAFQTESTNRTMLVVAQSYYHCWKAVVDGVAAPLLRANEGFQAVEVPAGAHQVLLFYQDRAFQIGSYISLVTVLLCVITVLPVPHKADRLAKAQGRDWKEGDKPIHL